jgi:hypothetical protein
VNYGELQTRVLRRLAADSNDPIADDVDEYVNEGIHYLETMAPDGWPWMRATVTMTTTVDAYTFTQLATLTTGSVSVAKILSARVLNSTYWQQLDFRTVDEAQQLYPNDTQTGPPEAFSVDGSTVTFYPAPNTSYTTELRVVTVEPDLSASGSSPTLPSVFHAAVVDAACLVAYQSLQDDKRMELYEQKVNRWVDRFRRYGNQSEASPRVKVRNWL